MLIRIQMHPIHPTNTHNRPRIEEVAAQIVRHPLISLDQPRTPPIGSIKLLRHRPTRSLR